MKRPGRLSLTGRAVLRRNTLVTVVARFGRAKSPGGRAAPASGWTRMSTARRLRRYTAGAALILFPALLVVAGADRSGHRRHR